MKNLSLSNSLSNPEVESLRAQVRQLRESVSELENRLADFEAGDQGDENQWGIWPYCYFVSGWNFGRTQFQHLGRKAGKWSLTRRNRRYALQNEPTNRELRLT